MNLPVSFIDYTRALLGNEEYEKLFAALEQEPPVSIRLNKLTIDSGQLTVAMQHIAQLTVNDQLSTVNCQLSTNVRPVGIICIRDVFFTKKASIF